jgi:hypothetical protein
MIGRAETTTWSGGALRRRRPSGGLTLRASWRPCSVTYRETPNPQVIPTPESSASLRQRHRSTPGTGRRAGWRKGDHHGMYGVSACDRHRSCDQPRLDRLELASIAPLRGYSSTRWRCSPLTATAAPSVRHCGCWPRYSPRAGLPTTGSPPTCRSPPMTSSTSRSPGSIRFRSGHVTDPQHRRPGHPLHPYTNVADQEPDKDGEVVPFPAQTDDSDDDHQDQRRDGSGDEGAYVMNLGDYCRRHDQVASLVAVSVAGLGCVGRCSRSWSARSPSPCSPPSCSPSWSPPLAGVRVQRNAARPRRPAHPTNGPSTSAARTRKAQVRRIAL